MNKTELLIAEALNADCWIKSETKFQECVARLLDGLGLLDGFRLPWCHVANERQLEVRYTRKGRAYCPKGNALKRAGVKSGVPDVLIFKIPPSLEVFPSHGCAIELKYGKNKPTPKQNAWLEALYQEGWYTNVAYSMKDVVAILERCGYVSV